MRKYLATSAAGILVALLAFGCGRNEFQSAPCLMPAADGGLAAMQLGSVKVLVFVRIDCPISNRYAPELRRIFERYQASDVAWWNVYPNPNLSVSDITKHQEEYDLPGLCHLDAEHRLVEQTGATITPEVAVYGRENELVYCGRIDNQHVDFGRSLPVATEHDLEDAIAAALNGEEIVLDRRKAVGCYIADLKPIKD